MGINTPQEYRELDDRAIDRMAEYAPSDILEIRRILGGQVMKAVFNTV
jgi:hypothetical protein